MQTAGEVVVKIIVTYDKDVHKRAKREINLFEVFHENRYICNFINGFSADEKSGAPAICASILTFYKLGTVESLIKDGKREYTKQANGISCLLLKHTIDMAKDVLSGLQCMHQMKFVHRDIKPGNICVKLLPMKDENRLQYIIIDLGAAVAIKKHKTSGPGASDEPGDDSSDESASFTGQFTSMAGQKLPLGTVPFMSPEHIDPSLSVDGRADIFGLGVTMFVCLCGRFPFVQPSICRDMKLLGVKMLQRYAMPREASTLKIYNTEVQSFSDEEVIAVVVKSLRKERKQRYRTAIDMKKHLEQIDR